MILFTANSVTSMHRSRGEQIVSCSSFHVHGKVLIFLAMLPRKGRSLSYVISQSCTSLLLYSPCSAEGCVVICIVCYLFVSLLISRTRHGYLRINSHQLLWISCLNGTLLISKIIVLCVWVGERVRYLTGAN